MIAEIYEKKLVQAGYELDVSVNGEDALQKMRAGIYDLVLLDLVLPGMDGVGVLKELSSGGKETLPSPVVVFSNLNDSDNQDAVFRFGASGFLPKSQFNPTELLNEVERFLRESGERKKNAEWIAAQKHGEEQGDVQDQRAQPHILFIEDEPVFVKLFTERLRKEGYRVSVAETGYEAVEVLEKESVDLIITDMLLPVMTGDELISKVRRDDRWKHIPIIVISASATDEQVQDVHDSGITGFFVKTRITPSELTAHAREVLQGDVRQQQSRDEGDELE